MSTPPLSRSNSNSHLESSDYLSGQNFSHQNEKRGVEDSTLIQSNRTKNGVGTTWQVAQAEANLQERPNLRSKRSQPRLFIGEDSLPNSTLHTAPVARDVSVNPNKISTSSALTPTPLSDIPSTPNSSSSGSSAIVASPKAGDKGGVHASELPKALSAIIDIGLQKHILKPEKLATLLVTVNSQCGKKGGSESENFNEGVVIHH